MRAATLIAFALLSAALPVQAHQPDPIDDLQWLFIEDTVALIKPPSEGAGEQARQLMALAAKSREVGDQGQMRAYLAQARVILADGTWDEDAAFAHSLALFAKHRVIDPDEPFHVIARQWYVAATSAKRLELHVGFRRKGSTDIIWRMRAEPASADLYHAGLQIPASPRDLPDGAYDLLIEARDGDRVIGQATHAVWIVKHLRRDLAEIARRKTALKLGCDLAASLEWPANLARTLDDRSRQPIDVDWRALLDRTLALAAKAQAGTDPLRLARGSHERHYASAVSHRIEPYRLFVPEQWDGKVSLPLVVLLHGSNSDHNRPFASGKAVELARARGWAVMAPMGYSPNSGWGNHLPVVLANGTMPAPRPSTIAGVVQRKNGVDPEPAEADVLDALKAVRTAYPIDASRIYLAGNSMGGEGTWHLAARHPQLWAAIAPGAGAIDPPRFPYASLGRLPVLGVHGDADEIISFAATEDMIERLNRADGKGQMLAVPGAGHRAFDTVLDQIFDFFASHSKEKAR
ncbi:MAG: dienelactone hydrolase family protein [Novosphingobium sp.]